MDLYAEEIISHYEHPHNKGRLDNADAKMGEYNPNCGDEITIYLKIADGRVKDAKFEGRGCAISVASASMLTDLVKEKGVGEIEKMGAKDVTKMIGVDPGPARIKCATLSLKAMKEALFLYEHKKVDDETSRL